MKNNRKKDRLAIDRESADQGEFFFAKFRLSDGVVYPRPVFVIGKKGDSNDDGDVIICSCTSTEKVRSVYDIEVKLKEDTLVRTNKIYTISKKHLAFKIKHNVDAQTIQDIINSCQQAIS